MTNLTEQLKKGKLNNGFYYVEINEPFKPLRVEIVENYNGLETDIDNNYIHEVLAEVPSYDEWQEKESQRINLMTKLNDVNNENHALEIEKNKLEQDFFAYQKMLNEANKDLNKYYIENVQLKELLIECRSPINYALCLNLSEEEKIEFKNLLAKIKQVLGEE